MSLKRATFTVRPRTREEIHYRTEKMERELARRRRREEKLAKRFSTEH